MDSLTYTYGNGYGGYSRNQLHCLNEDAPDLYGNDIKYQHACDTAPPNYAYDPIGNTTMDLVSGQRDIKWNIYNKVVETINATDSVIMRFKYDGAGNRIAKYFMQRMGTDTNCKNDYYVRDAQGNILATYKDDFQYDGGGTLLSRKYHLAEHDIYGSSRLGVKNYWPSQHRWLWDQVLNEYDSLTINQRQPWYSLEYQDIVQKDSLDVYGSTHTGIWKSVGITGQKQYEITDHLGNVLSTVSDARGSNAPHTSTDSFTITSYEPAIKSITDYYPFGMQMPDRCYSDGTTHTTNISAVTTVPVHHMVNRVWPDFAATSIGGAVILTGSSPLGLVASGTETLSYELPRYIGGLLHTVRIFTHGTVPPGFRAEISIGGTGPTAFSGISTDLTYLSSSASVPYLHIYNLGMRDTIFIDSVHIDSATYEPYHVLSSISSSDGYAYGFNGQMKVNEWAGSGNHTTALFWEYDVRTGRRGNLDPVDQVSISNYACLENNPISGKDINGDQTSFDIRSRQNDQRFLKGEITKYQWSKFYCDNGKAGAIGGAALLTIYTGGRAMPLIRTVSSWAIINQEIVIGVGALTAGLIDPNPANDYPGGLDDIGKNVRLLFRNKGIERYILNTSKFDFFFGKVTAGVNATKREISNAYKSAERYGIWNKLGIFDTKSGRDAIAEYCDYALSHGKETYRELDQYGVTFTKQITLVKGEYSEVANFQFLIRPGAKVPEVTSISFPKATKKR